MQPTKTHWIEIAKLAALGLIVVTNVRLIYSAYISNQTAAVAAVAAKESADEAKKLLRSIADDVHPPTATYGLKQFIWNCYTSAHETTCTFTNPSPTVAVACIKGIVTNKESRKKSESIVACTGEMKWRETKVVRAAYSAGSVSELCPGPYGGVKWDLCSFDVLDAAK